MTGVSRPPGLRRATIVTITGTNLAGATLVKFGTAATIISDTATKIVATSPARPAGTVDVTVVTVGGTSAKSSVDHFTYVARLLTMTPQVPQTNDLSKPVPPMLLGQQCRQSFQQRPANLRRPVR